MIASTALGWCTNLAAAKKCFRPLKKHVIPAKAGIQVGRRWHAAWTPAFAGVTQWDGDGIGGQSQKGGQGDLTRTIPLGPALSKGKNTYDVVITTSAGS